jgi:hypothetical protein
VTTNDESILGLLLRAHKQASAQAHGEKYVFNNISAWNHFDTCTKNIEAAILSLSFAEQYVARADAAKEKTR